jgi:hypothetical protein
MGDQGFTCGQAEPEQLTRRGSPAGHSMPEAECIEGLEFFGR